MDKINKEELMKRLNLTEEDQEKVAGGNLVSSVASCREECDEKEIQEMNSCDELYADGEALFECISSSYNSHINCLKSCESLSV